MSDREEGPYSDLQIAQMFADRRVNRSTACRKIEDKEWRTIDDYLPTLKYGTQLPPPTPKVTATPVATAPSAYHRVALVDLDIPFVSILRMMFKWMAAAFVVWCCFLPLALAAWFIIFAAMASFFGQVLSAPHQP